jgi:hypothetical protein
MARSPKTPDTTTTTKPATFDLNDPTLKAIMAEAVATALAGQRAEFLQAMADQQQATKPAAMNGKSERSIANEIAVTKAFKKAGFGNVVPHKDVMTFNRWMAQGFRPVEGSKSLKIRNLRLFHKSQVRKLTADELKASKDQSEAAIARHTAKVTPLHPGNPQ